MTIVDVRTPIEFQSGHIMDSINIPFQELPDRVEEMKAMSQPLLFCCTSGNRSGQATMFMKSLGVDCSNAGSWLGVNSKLQTA